MEVEIDIHQLIEDLRDHFGTLKSVTNHPFLSATLATIDTLAANSDWEAIIALAEQEGFNISTYVC